MAGKPIKTTLKLLAPAKQANPAPPIGPALGQHGINIAGFCKEFNDATKDMTPGEMVPALITVYEDRSFSFTLGTPPASVLLKKAAGIEKGSATGAKTIVGKVTMAQVKEIAERKKNDLNAYDEAAAIKIIAGTAKNMGIEISG
ncbi:MAG: 50S ribosomal protein L11 [Candidatus Harrisonbacteria bacterium]|nr:50S ribosomal protein L11 [Candidatus Harrisonbacteria bacterium]